MPKTESTAQPGIERNATQTRERILDAAERLFAEHGLEGVSTRDITALAEANVGAISYYFGSKEGLVFAVFDRRLTPITRERLAALDGEERAAGKAGPKAEAVLRAYIRPAVEHALDPKWGSTSFAKLMGRLIGEPGTTTVERLKKAHFDRLAKRFDAALVRAIPTLSPEGLACGKTFMVGSLHYLLLMLDEALPCLMDRKPDCEDLVQRLVRFAAAGLRAA
ncbi:MAG TPA: TetR family transcriptional regulator [Dongiaceae bacterium]|nr:TetR family transcriptional regulator [Dongiaceae bacterium]